MWCVSGEWTLDERQDRIVCDLELFASNIGLDVLGSASEASHFYEFTDNSVALMVMRSMNPNSVALQRLMQWRMGMLEGRGWRSAPERISTKNNLWADALSRGRLEWVRMQVESLGMRLVVLDAATSRRVGLSWLL